MAEPTEGKKSAKDSICEKYGISPNLYDAILAVVQESQSAGKSVTTAKAPPPSKSGK